MQSPSVAAGTASGKQSALVGMTAVVSACLLSGLAGVWLERIVKVRVRVRVRVEVRVRVRWLERIVKVRVRVS